MLTYLLFRLAAFLARRLPERWGTAIARWLGRVIYCFSPVSEAGRDNVRHVLGPGADPICVSWLAREAFQSRLLNYYDMVRISGLPLAEITGRVVLEGREHIDRLLEQKRGMVIVSGHVGPMEFMIQAVVALGYPLIGITEHLEPEKLHQYVMALRTAHGLDLISTQGSLLDVYRRLKRGEALLSAIDRDSTNTGLVVDLFGAPAWMPSGYARVAVRADVPVLFGCCYRTRDGRIANKIHPPIFPDRSLGKEEATVALVRQVARLLEETLRDHLDQWHLSAPIWQLGQEKLEQGKAR